MPDTDRPQWTMTVTVFHGASYGHSIELTTTTTGRDTSTHDSIGSWRGVGIPSDVLRGAVAMVHGALEEHLVTRYGISHPSLQEWGDESGPF